MASRKAPEPITIPSFRVVFSIERRLFRVGDLRIPAPQGIPLAAAAYFVGAFVLVLGLGALPVAGSLLGALPFPVHYAVLPGGLSWGLHRARLDGRSGPRLLRALVFQLRTPGRVAGWREAEAVGVARVADVTVAPDHTGPTLPRAELAVPRVRRGGRGRQREVGFVLGYACEAWEDGQTLHVRQVGDAPLSHRVRIGLAPGQGAVFHGRG